MAFGLGATIIANNNTKMQATEAVYTPGTHYEVSDTAAELASYYSSITDSMSGSSLLSALQSLNSSKRKKTVGYSTMGTSTSGAFIYTDYDLNSTATDSNGQTYGTKVASFYTKTASTSWNREHTWPNSHGGNLVENDIHMTRPTITSENSSRGNSFYVEGKNSSSAGWDPYTAGYDAQMRGECARIILYAVVAAPTLSLSDADSHSTSNSNPDYLMGNMNTLIKWHFQYSPNQYEINRNNGGEYLQGNRNPFIDHPEYVARIWSDFNSTVSSLCDQNASMYDNWTPGTYSSYGTNDAAGSSTSTGSLSISSTSKTITVGDTSTIYATSSDSSTITWSTSDSSVCSISKTTSGSGSSNAITLTAEGTGTATIGASATIGGKQYSKTCSVTVTTSGGSGSGSGSSGTATYTVASTSSVTPNGAPSGSSATYSQTYTTTAGQITKDNSATLTLSG